MPDGQRFPNLLTRRYLLVSVGAELIIGSAQASSSALSKITERIAGLEEHVGGVIGLAALDTASGARISYRADERFAMCSTFKLMLAAAVLSRVDKGSLRLGQPVLFSRSQLLPNSPIADAHPQGGTVALAAMLQSMIEASDNTAANRLLALVGGPPGYTAYLRGIGDATTRLDRVELDLNTNVSGDPRDTTSPNAMLDDMRRVADWEAPIKSFSRAAGQLDARLSDWTRSAACTSAPGLGGGR